VTSSRILLRKIFIQFIHSTLIATEKLLLEPDTVHTVVGKSKLTAI